VGKRWLVAFDGSDSADSAFNFTVGLMNKVDDHLFLVGVSMHAPSMFVRFAIQEATVVSAFLPFCSRQAQ